jgi:hypothetical protein
MLSQAAYDAPNPSPISSSDSLYRKVAWRIMPILFAGYIIAYIDRVNVGFAKLQMMGDLGFSDSVYGFGAGIFFLGYILLEIPSWLPGGLYRPVLPWYGTQGSFMPSDFCSVSRKQGSSLE